MMRTFGTNITDCIGIEYHEHIRDVVRVKRGVGNLLSLKGQTIQLAGHILDYAFRLLRLLILL